MNRAMSLLAWTPIVLAIGGCQNIGPFRDCVDVQGSFNAQAPGFIVSYHAGVDATTKTAELEAKHGFTATHVLTSVPGFGGELSNSALAGVRCESAVRRIEYNGVVHVN